MRARGVLAAISHFVFLMLYLPCWRRQTTRQLTNHGFQTYCTMHEPLNLNLRGVEFEFLASPSVCLIQLKRDLVLNFGFINKRILIFPHTQPTVTDTQLFTCKMYIPYTNIEIMCNVRYPVHVKRNK